MFIVHNCSANFLDLSVYLQHVACINETHENKSIRAC